MHQSTLKELYKRAIRINGQKLQDLKEAGRLTLAEETCINYVNFNPRAMLVLDDCAASLKSWCQKSPSIKELFYEGRHYFVTLIITSQSDKELPSEMRQNTSISIFTKDQAAISSFNRKSDAYPKYIQTRALVCAHEVFSSRTRYNNYMKLIYFNDDDSDDPFYYTIAEQNVGFKVGAPQFWQIDEICEKKEDNDVFLEKYRL